jgi:hypothetical protein
MLLIEKLHSWLISGPTPDCDQIVAAALENAEPIWFERLLELLAVRAHATSWAGLVGVYERLPPDFQTMLSTDASKLGEAVEIALKGASTDCRLNAIKAFQAHAATKHAFLMAATMREPGNEVRAAAGQALRSMADQHFDRLSKQTDWCDEDREALEADRRALSQAASEAFRSFDLHHRVEALEVGLWFTAELGDAVWELLGNHRSRAANVVSDHLPRWNSYRLAGFLLAALRNPTWRPHATAMLETWREPQQLVALLRHTHLLSSAEVCAHLTVLRGRAWYAFDANMSGVPRELRATVPRWITHVGLKDDERAELLSRWCDSQHGDVQRATVYALAWMDAPAAVPVLRQVSTGTSAAARFARWYLAGGDSGFVRSTLKTQVERRMEQRQAAFTPPAEEPVLDTSFSVIWMACRRAAPQERAALLATIRDHLDVWRVRLRAMLRSADARDRLLFLQIVGTAELANRFRRDIELLRDDSLEPIKRLATNLLRGVAPATDGAREPEPAETGEICVESAQSDEIRGLLAQIGRDPEAAKDPAVVAQMRAALNKACAAPTAEPVSAEGGA